MIKEFNNRKIADKHAEYITGQELRKYLARKVKKYVGDNLTVFDGAVGSGQLQQFINARHVYGVEIQKGALEAFEENYKNSSSYLMSFFNFNEDIKADCTIMNYPFSLKYNELSDEERANIQKEFPWKKSGVVDDIFILKSLNYTKRYGFYICFPGIAYRKSEKIFRDLIGANLVELNVIENAFDDTAISVIFLVIDKDKASDETYKEIYDCKIKNIIHSESCKDDVDRWVQPRIEIQKEVIDIVQLERDIALSIKRRRKIERELDNFIRETFYSDDEIDDAQVSLFE